MADWTFDQEIAKAIEIGRSLGLPTARGAAQHGMGPLSDRLWESIAPKWEWHFLMSDDELKQGARRPAILP
jgi:hypothetical protein